jgi:hypothetical protein
MSKISKVEKIQEFKNNEIVYGVYSVVFNDKECVFIRNGDSVGAVSFLFGESASKCVHEIRNDVKQELFNLLKDA